MRDNIVQGRFQLLGLNCSFCLYANCLKVTLLKHLKRPASVFLGFSQANQISDLDQPVFEIRRVFGSSSNDQLYEVIVRGLLDVINSPFQKKNGVDIGCVLKGRQVVLEVGTPLHQNLEDWAEVRAKLLQCMKKSLFQAFEP